MARALYNQPVGIGGQVVSVRRNETMCEARAWTIFKFISAIVGWVAFAAFLVFFGVCLGGGGAAMKVVAPAKVTVRVETPGLDKAIGSATARVEAAAEKAAKALKAMPSPPPIIVQVPAPAPAPTASTSVEKQEQPVPPPPPVKKEEKPKSIWFYNR